MLLNLRQKRKNFSLNRFVGAFTPKFNPLNLPSYRAGYVMNLTTDVPSGSIDPAPSSGWFDAKVLNNTSKLMNRGTATNTSLVNGFKCESIEVTTARLRNQTTDIFSGVTDYSFVLGFNRGAVGAGHMLFSCRNDADSCNSYLLLRNSRKLEFGYTHGANQAIITSAQNYDTGTWHAVVCTVNQTTKTVTLKTDLGEDLTNTNALISAPIALTSTNFNYTQFGAWWVASLFYSPGLLGDIIIFNTALDVATQNALLSWEKKRLGI